MGSARTHGGWLWTLVVLLIGCGGKTSTPTPPGDGGSGRDVPAACVDAAPANRPAGQACSCASDCASGFCADGVCCQTACGEACKSCALPGTAGACVARPAGGAPRTAAACQASQASTCGFDGACDGAGACRKHRAGTPCKSGRCDGDAVVEAFACDGEGLCKPAPTVVCAPFSCNAAGGRCFDTCTVSSQCVAGQQCVNASCGKKMTGASCAAGEQCATGYCADGVCCNIACQGSCVACNVPGREGVCSAAEPGDPDPHGVCRDQGAASCGTTGRCAMFGACARYAADTQCVPPACASGNRVTPARTCDGLGACQTARTPSGCSPFLCAAGACTTGCTTSADCDTGRICENGTCGPKPDGLACAASVECRSGFCVDGVCCENACAGGCRSCALPSSPGRCTSIAAGNVDTRGVCKDDGASACGNNGRCDGASGCQKYANGTACRGESCNPATNVFTPGAACNGLGACVTPATRNCMPYVCNGPRCFGACTVGANCQSPNVCNGSSCGPKPNGASCSGGGECGSGVCVQGICCNVACGGACKSCALPASLGTCSNVPDGAPDPQGTCGVEAAQTCGRDGACDGNGACRRHAAGTRCADPLCPADGMLSSARTCDGAGLCRAATTSSCAPFTCDGAAACRATCAGDGECAGTNICDPATRECAAKHHLGEACGTVADCLNGNFCVAGVCCRTDCQDQGAASCGTDGRCDASGTCAMYGTTTMCEGPSCPADTSTATPARFCDGAGACAPATSITACLAYRCDDAAGTCRTACANDAHCTPPGVCDVGAGTCGGP